MMHNNIMDDKKLVENNEYIYNVIKNGDIDLIKHVNNKIFTDNDHRFFLVSKILNSNYKINYLDIRNFFAILSPLNIEYNMGDKKWNYKLWNEYLLIQNSVLKQNISPLFYDMYINKIKHILNISEIKYYYKEFKDRRNNKTKDIIFIILPLIM